MDHINSHPELKAKVPVFILLDDYSSNCNQHSDFTCQIIYEVEIQLKYSFNFLYKYVLFIDHSSQSIIHGKVHTATSWWHHKTTSS